jgi:uncharacterized protein with ATP-grasp and redox domains
LKVRPSCIACAILRRAVELEALIDDTHNRERLSILRELVDAVNLYSGPDIEVAELLTVSYRRIKQLAPRVKDIYEEAKKVYLPLALSRAERISEYIEKLEDGEALKFLLKAAALASALRVFHPTLVILEPPSEMDVINAKMGIDDSDKAIDFLREMGGEGTVYYVLGGIAELPYDIMLARKLRDTLGVRVVAVVNSERFEDHVTLADLEEQGYVDEFDYVEVVHSDAASIIRGEAPSVYQSLQNAQLVIVKRGIHVLHFMNNNVETPMLMLFTAYCNVLASAFKVNIGTVNVVFASGQEAE